MNTIMEKAQQQAYLDFLDIKKIQEKEKPIPVARSLKTVSVERLAEKKLEKVAPSTGYPDLDMIVKGFIPGHLYTLTGNENVGKTSLACNFAVRVAKQGKKILYFALEPENMVVDYIASVRLDKKFDDLEPEDLDWDGDIRIYGKEFVSTVEDLVHIVKESERFDLIIIDHVGYFVTNSNQWVQQQSNAIKQLAGLAKEKQSAIMMIAHLRKRSQQQKKDYLPTSDDIAGSGAFKQDSTEVMIVIRQTEGTEDVPIFTPRGKLYVTKTKCGPNGAINLFFSERKANITSVRETATVAQAQNELDGLWSEVSKNK